MKKIAKTSVALLASALFVIPSVNAAQLTTKDLDAYTKDADGYTTDVYVLGKYAFADKITTAQIMDAVRTLDDASNAVLFYKDSAGNWSNAVKASETYTASEAETLALGNITRIFNLEEINNAAQAAVDGGDATIVNKNTLALEESGEVTFKVTGVKKYTVKTSDGDAAARASLSYNEESLNVGLANNTLSLTETKPLYAYNGGKKTVKLVVNTNKKITAAALNAGATMTIATSNITDSSFTLTINAPTVTESGTLTLSYTDDEGTTQTKTYLYTYNALNTISGATGYVTTESVEIVPTTADVKVVEIPVTEATYETTGKYVHLFYTEAGKTVTGNIEFKENGDLKSASSPYVTANVIETIDNFEVSVATPREIGKAKITTEADKLTEANKAYYNQDGAIELVKVEDSTDKDFDKIVTLSMKKVIKGTDGYEIKFNLGVNITGTEVLTAKVNGADESLVKAYTNGTETAPTQPTKTTDFLVTLKAVPTSTTAPAVANVEFNDTTKKLRVKFVVNYAVADTELNTIVPAAATDLLVTSAANLAYKDNNSTKVTTSNITKELDKDKTEYTVSVLPNSTLNAFKRNETDTEAPYVAMVLDFGVKANFVKVTEAANVKLFNLAETANYGTLTDAQKETLRVNLVANTGVSADNAVIVWVKSGLASGNTLTVKNLLTNKDINVTINIKQLTAVTVDADYANATEVVDTDIARYSNGKFYVASTEKQFRVTNGTSEYVYFTKAGTWADTKVIASVKLVGASAMYWNTEATYDDDGNDGTDSLIIEYNNVAKTMGTVTRVDNNNVTVNLNRQLTAAAANKEWYVLVLDLGTKAAADAIKNNTSVADKYKILANGYTFVKDVTAATENKERYVALLVNAYETNKTDGLTVELEYTGADLAGAKYPITIKSTQVANETDLTIKGVEKITSVAATYTDAKNVNADGKKVMNANNAAITNVSYKIDTENKKNYVYLTYDKQFATYAMGGQTKSWVGVLVDFGTKVSDVNIAAASNYAAFEASTNFNNLKTNTKSVVWLNIPKFEDVTNFTTSAGLSGAGWTYSETEESWSQEFEFTNGNTDNQNNKIKVVFVIKPNYADFAVSNVRLASATTTAEVSSKTLYTSNQNITTFNYKAATKTDNAKIALTRPAADLVAYAYPLADGTRVDPAKNFVAVLIDLGVNPELIEDTSGAVLDGSAYGATGTEFVYFVDAETAGDSTETFTNTYNDKTVTVDIKVANK